jgi:hypothetical protein
MSSIQKNRANLSGEVNSKEKLQAVVTPRESLHAAITPQNKLQGSIISGGNLQATIVPQKSLHAEVSTGSSLQGKMSKPQTVLVYELSIDETLKLNEQGALGVNTATEVEKDNTLPITAAAVHTTVGNIEILLSTI